MKGDAPVRFRDDPEGPAALREGLTQLGATEMPAAARARLARNLGLGPAAPAGGGGKSLLTKLGVGLGIVVGGAAIVWWLQRPPRPVAPVAVAAAPSAQQVVLPPAPVAAAPEVSAQPVASPPVASPARSPHAPSATALPDEATLFRNAGAALHGGDPGRALELINEQASRFPNGTFAQEREVLRIDALVALGRNDEARDRARAFLAQHPESAHRPRLERMLSWGGHGGG